MSFSYTYVIVAERGSADALIRAVCDHLEASDKSRVVAALSHGAADVMVNVKRDLYELRGVELRGGSRRQMSVCLTLLFPPDGPLSDYARAESLKPQADGRLRIGCVHTSIDFGSAFVRITAHSATGDMGRLFEASASVRATFCAIARAGAALSVPPRPVTIASPSGRAKADSAILVAWTTRWATPTVLTSTRTARLR
ncbi:MAG TPA: hypothetical protein VF796_28810 [Humisphaera sp.]